ncbi:MAG TPA: LysR family transcriptional regulator [Polyangia bacterium]
MDSTLLHTFRVVCETGRISMAARVLHLSQPAVSQQVQKLEHACRQPLLTRSARGVSVTPAGDTLLAYARRVDELLEEADAALSRGAPSGGELRLAASTTLASYVVPRLFARFRVREPAASLRLTVVNTAGVLELVRSGEVALGLVEGAARVAHVHTEPFFDDAIVPCVAAAADKLAFAVPRTAADLAGAPLVMRERGSGTREVVERALRQAGVRRLRGATELELGSTEACKAAVEAGLAVGFLARVAIDKELALGTLRPIEIRRLQVTRTFRWALSSAAAPAGIAGRFYEFARGWRP